MLRNLIFVSIIFALSGCVAATDVGVAAGIGAGVIGIVNNGRQVVRANIDQRCQRWFVAEGDWYIAQRLSGGMLDQVTFQQLSNEANDFCIHAWRWPGKNADDMVVSNTNAVLTMIAGNKPHGSP